jgi:serine protease Do
VSDQLRTSGRVIRGRIGVQIGEVTKDVAESIGLGKPMGAFVRSVESGGPADKAGIEAGDIITRFDGKPVERAGELPRLVGAAKPGTRSTVQVFRRGSSRDIAVTVVEFEAEQPRRIGERDNKAPATAATGSLGLAVSDLNEAQKRELKVKGGVRVDTAEGAAQRAGLKEGDVILSIDNTEVSTARQFESVVAKIDRTKPVNALVRRGDWVNYVVIRVAR